jgi:hypothetical protein
MDHETFVKECLKVASWFDPLNPYETKGPLFKVEDVNCGVESKDLAPLYCYAISSKRYAMFNLDANGEPKACFDRETGQPISADRLKNVCPGALKLPPAS